MTRTNVRWADTTWLEENLDRDMVIIDTQPNIHDYVQEHIPGAVYFNEGLMRVPLYGRPGVYVPDRSIEAVLSRIGVENDKTALVYSSRGAFSGQGDGLAQTMMTYSLARYGVKDVYILNGGLDKWKCEDKALTREFPTIEPSNFIANVHEELFIDYERFREMKDDEEVALLDARPEKFYTGQGPWIQPGHIPGAINLPWKTLMEPDNAMLLKDDNTINEIIGAKGIGRDKTIICSCGTGREATNEFILFKWYLKFPEVVIYEGSFTEWSSYPKNSTVTGSEPW